MSRLLRLAIGAFCAAALFGLRAGIATPTTLAGDPCYHGFELPATTVAAGTEVRAEPCAFEPAILTVPAGATVTFRNDTALGHLVTGAHQEWGDRDAELAPATEVAYTFVEPGIYPYSCALHRGMTGAIVVGDGGAALASLIGPAAGAAGAPAAVGAGRSDPTLVVLLLSGLAVIAGTLAFVVRRRRVAAVTPEPLAR